ncbi:hypothetical protein KRP22_002212 [Phytophthora ramorum]|nr:hypothetical protein KRP22_1495 [Phytophthora ramorum]
MYMTCIQRRLPKVNRATAERLLENEAKSGKRTAKRADGEDDDADKSFSNPLGDDRFSRMFTSTDFQVDEESDTYRMLHPNAVNAKQQRTQQEDMDSDAGTDDENEDDEVGDRFARVDEEEEEEIEGRPSDESSDEEEEEPQRETAPKGKRKPAPKFYEIAEGEKVGDLMAFGSSGDRAAQREKKQLAKLPLSERLKMQRVTEKERSAFKKEETTGGGYVREMSFVPQADLRKQQRARERERESGEADDGDSAFGNGKRRKKRGVGDLKLSNPAGRGRFR